MLYRRQRGPLNLWLTLTIAVLALILGFLAGRLSAPPATLTALMAPDQQHLRRASGALDIAELEYARALQGNAASAAASRRAVQQAGAELGQVQVLRQLLPAQVRAAQEALAGLDRGVRQQRDQASVTPLIEQVRARLGALTPEPGGTSP